MEIEPSQPHLLSDQVKWMIIHYKKLGYGDRKTARTAAEEYNRIGLSHHTVKSVWEKYRATQTVHNAWSLEGRPPVTSERDEKRLRSYYKRNPRNSISEAKVDLRLSASRSTLNRVALKEGLKAYKAPSKIQISERNMERRLQFANEMRYKKGFYWGRWVFSDESSFTLYNPNGRTFVRRSSGNDFREEHVQFRNQGPTLMVWGAISSEGVGPLVRIDRIEEGSNTLNGERYLTLLQRHLLQTYPYLTDQRYVFQQDNAPCHKSQVVTNWFEFKGINRANWPAQSPDLNLIECVWNEMKFRIRGENFTNKDELWKRLKKEWNSISLEFIDKLYENMPDRIKAVQEAEGGNTKY